MKWKRLRNLAMLHELVNGRIYPEYVTGIVFGNFYVYDNRKEKKQKRLRGWLVMHKPSAERIAVMKSKKDAKEMVRILHRNNLTRAAMQSPHRKELRERTPRKIQKWVLKCSKRKKLLPR